MCHNCASPMMKPKANRAIQRSQALERIHGEGPNWVLIVGGALWSTLAVRFGCKLNQVFQNKNPDNARQERVKSAARRRSGACQLHSNLYCYPPEEDGCYHFPSGILSDIKLVSTNEAADMSLPLVKVPTEELHKDGGGVLWSSSPDLLGLPQKPFNHSNCSESPCASESGSDIYMKREVIQKLRQQLQRRDEMIMEMQSQIMDLRNSLSIQMTHSANLQSQIDSANRELFDSEREMQQLRKAIADHCSSEVGSPEKPGSGKNWRPDSANGHKNGYMNTGEDLELHYDGGEVNGDEGKVAMLKREAGELKEVIQGKDYLLESYKEQKVELSSKIKELQLKLTSQVPDIL